MNLSFHGAASCVTGSCHLLDVDGFRILVDCGMFQGPDELFSSNDMPFGFDPESVSVVLLTHAHLDHCGRLPLLVKKGFRGPIIATLPTRYLAEIVLWDAAHLQEEKTRAGEGGERRRSPRTEGSPDRRSGQRHALLYTLPDVIDTMALFARPAEYEMPVNLAPGIDASFHNAGHILGSSSIRVTVTRPGRKTRILFSGDLGPEVPALLSPSDPPLDNDYVVMETTYGDRLHRSFAASKEELLGVLTDTRSRKGNVLIPTFALERAQDLLSVFREWFQEGRLPKDLHVFLDSPMAIDVTQIYGRFPELLSEEARRLTAAGEGQLFLFPGLRMTRSAQESRSIRDIPDSRVVLAGSGMISGGRILHHLSQEIDNPRSSLVFVGFQSEGTLGRRIVDGAKTVTLLGRECDVRIGTHFINGFSAHADQGDLLDWCRPMKAPETVFLVHGERPSLSGFREVLEKEGWTRIHIPVLHEIVEIPEKPSARKRKPAVSQI